MPGTGAPPPRLIWRATQPRSSSDPGAPPPARNGGHGPDFWKSLREEVRMSNLLEQANDADKGSPRRLEADPWIAKVLFGVLLTVLVVSEAALYSGLATIPETWPLN